MTDTQVVITQGQHEDLTAGYVPLTRAASDIEVSVGPHSSGDGRAEAVVKDTVRKRAWSGEGRDGSSAATEAMRKFLSDPKSREYASK